MITCLLSITTHAQFSVSAVATNENCPGTGSLTLSVQNSNPSVPVNYKVYLLPETNVPFWNSSNPLVQGIQDGEYKIVASQNINGSLVTAQTFATVGSNYVPLSFSINSTNAVCGNDGSMVIDVTAGTPATYELLEGPATAGPQASNTFYGLPAGTYKVRVTDNCGNGFVSTQTFYVEQPTLSLAGPSFGGSLTSCNTTNVNYTVTAEGSSLGIVYPLTVKFVVYPPSGAATTYNQVITSGPANGLQLSQSIPYYTNPYSIDLEVTDPCGTIYLNTNGAINQPMSATASVRPVLCGAPTLAIAPSNHMPPYTITFTSVPAGFNPSDYNATYPGAFSGPEAVFGDELNTVPMGSYECSITDACGHTTTTQIVIGIPEVPEPTVSAVNSDCVTFLGSVTINIPYHPLQTAEIISAPGTYTQPLPQNTTSLIEDGVLRIDDLPQGEYILNLTDICGNTYTNISAVVPEYSFQEPQYVLRPDCEIGNGTVRISDNLTSVIITAAPATFTQPLPYNASANINNGAFTMDALPEGNYTFNVSTVCDDNISSQVTIPGFSVTQSEIELLGNCVNFDLDLNYVSSAEELVTFWLQKYNDEINAWMNPETGAVYTEGTTLNDVNAIELTNNALNPNIPYIGKFRVMKSQKAYAYRSQGANVKYCNEEFYEFEFYNELDIKGIYNLTCVGEIIDIMVYAVGAPPLRYEIISKNGDTSFYIDNADNNTFYGLEGAMYVVRITDPCGGYRTEQFNVSELPPLVSATQPADLAWCDVNGTGTATFDLTSQTPAIIDDLDPDIVTVTYHTSLADAENDMNAISSPNAFTAASIMIFARVEWNVNTACYGIASFRLNVAPPTPLQMDDKWAFCPGQSVTVIADEGYTSYTWSTGETTGSIEVSEAGTYTVTAISLAGCEVSKTIQVVPAAPPVIAHVEINDFAGDNNTIIVHLQDMANADLYEYSIDGAAYQESNIFANVPAGMYTVTVRDRFGCSGSDDRNVHLLDYPKFFTPNGDGVHDKWRIEYAALEPNMKVYIYDRYGKPITYLSPTSDGWDGTLEGNSLPATDYWFVIKREDGREHRGHFAMKR